MDSTDSMPAGNGVSFTERETDIVRLRDEEKLSWSKIGEQVGTTKSSANSSYRHAKKKLTAAADPERAKPRKTKAHGATSEVKKPEETAAFLDAALEPFTTIEQAARACGFPSTTAQRLIARMKARYKPVDDAVRRVKDGQMITLLEDRGRRCLEYADDFAMAGAPLRDLMVSAGIAIDKARLLKGESTQILTVEDRRSLLELGKALNDELRRRGMLIDVTAESAEQGS